MNPQDRITIRISHTTTIEFFRLWRRPRKYRIRPADLPRLHRLFNSESWPAYTNICANGLVEMEFCVSDRELPEPEPIPDVEHAEEFWAAPFEPDPLASYMDYLETMADEVAATRS